MRQVDLSPLFRYSVGFDRLDQLFDAAFRNSGQDSAYPPYNIVKTGDDAYKITLAVAGFGEDDLEIVVKESLLTVKGKGAEADDAVYLHRGIGRRAFEHRFQLADHVKVTGAGLVNGLLDIQLVREVPEAMKPQEIKIGTATKPRVIESKATAA
jgi:molecular chaperone IbpA